MYLHPCQYEPMKAAAQQQQSPKGSGGWGWVAGHPHDSYPENRSLHPLWNQTKHLCLNLTRVTSTLCIWMRRGVGEHTNTEGKEGFHWLVKEWDEQTIERRPHMKLKCIQEIVEWQTLHCSFPFPQSLDRHSLLFSLLFIFQCLCPSLSFFIYFTSHDPLPNPSSYPSTLSTTPWPNTVT